MRQRLQKIYWTGIIITLLMAFASIAVATRLELEDTKSQLTALTRAASRWTLDSEEDFSSLTNSIASVSPSLRVTFILDSGVILADSLPDADADLKSSHVNDPEIISAREGNVGSNLRMSSAEGAFVLYVAQRVSPGLILRLGYPVFELARIIGFYGTLLLVLFLVLYHLQRRSIARYAADQKRQLDSVRALLDGETDHAEAVFPEFQPSLEDISYRIRRLREDREEIMRTMNLRADFVANASHELRSPLTSIRGFAEMMDEGLAENEEERQLCVQTILQECERMLTVIEDLLRLEKSQQVGIIPAEPVSAALIAEEVCRSLAPQAGKKHITLSCSGDSLLHVREQNLWEILYNLTDNAIRYGREGGSVRIEMSPGKIVVKDDGIGIDEQHVGHIFEKFYRVDEARDDSAGGTGLGLSIVRAIISAYGGDISAQSIRGEGSTFFITFPVEE